jgi:hypothetical protein
MPVWAKLGVDEGGTPARLHGVPHRLHDESLSAFFSPFFRCRVTEMSSSGEASRRCFLWASGSFCVAMSAGCGLLLYPERRGQPSGRLDWGVVLLDALGLLLFLVPGVVAFAVDFATGAIYLPPERPSQVLLNRTGGQLVKVEVPRDQITRQRVEEIVSNHVGRPIRLIDGEYRAERMGSIEEFWGAVARMNRGTS